MDLQRWNVFVKPHKLDEKQNFMITDTKSHRKKQKKYDQMLNNTNLIENVSLCVLPPNGNIGNKEMIQIQMTSRFQDKTGARG